MSIFTSSKVQLDNFIVNSVVWANHAPIAAMACNATDDDDPNSTTIRGYVKFSNTEGEIYLGAEVSNKHASVAYMTWHPTMPVLAIGWEDGMVSTVTLQLPTSTENVSGIHSTTHSTRGQRSRVQQLSTNSTIHSKSMVKVLQWSPSGHRLVTGDTNGLVCVWKTDYRGALSVICKYRGGGMITSLVFCSLPTKLKDPITGTVTVVPPVTTSQMAQAMRQNQSSINNKNGGIMNQMMNKNQLTRNLDNKILTLTAYFFYATENGSIFFADDNSHSSIVCELHQSIDKMFYFIETSSLVILTRNMNLLQYVISEDGHIKRASLVKIAISTATNSNGDSLSDLGLQSMEWAGPGLLCAATEERLVRFFDLLHEESYSISLQTALGAVAERTDRVVSVAFNPIDRCLAIGTATPLDVKSPKGIVAVWRYIGTVRDLSKLSEVGLTTGNRSKNSSSNGTTTNSSPLPSDLIESSSPNDWQLIFRTVYDEQVVCLSWYGHGNTGHLSVTTFNSSFILTESVMHAQCNSDLSVLQEGEEDLLVHLPREQMSMNVKTGLSVKGLALSHSCFVVWSSKIAKIYRVDHHTGRVDPCEPTECTSTAMCLGDTKYLSEEAWFVATPSEVRVLSFSGVQKGAIALADAEGIPSMVDLNGRFLAVMTDRGHIFVYDVSVPKRSKPVGTAGNFYGKTDVLSTQNGKPTSIITEKQPSGVLTTAPSGSDASAQAVSVDRSQLRPLSIKINSSGTKIAVLCARVTGAQSVHFPATALYVFDRLRGTVLAYDFAPRNRYPVSIHWDESDDRICAVEAQSVQREKSTPTLAATTTSNSPTEETKPTPIVSNTEVFLMFVTSDAGIRMQDSIPTDEPFGSLIGFSVPHLFYRSSTAKHLTRPQNSRGVNTPHDEVPLLKRTMRDFVGILNVTDLVCSALLDFSFFLTLGKLDEAYRVVKEIDSPAIWENMAQMCVKTRRLDVAEVCLGNMGNARGAAAVRASKVHGSLDVSIGVLAIQLGLLDDAVACFKSAERYDLLNRLYQAAGLWDKAISLSETHDRIHRKLSHYQYAKYLESLGRINEAISHFEASDNARTEVPRMLFHLGRTDELAEYVAHSDDTALSKWWAAYLESIDRIDKARRYYAKAGDHLSLVRIYCFRGELEKAGKVIAETGDRASAYHFARHLEHAGEIQEAITFYATSGCYNHCIRLAMSGGYDGELMRYALKSTPALMIECAAHFEEKQVYDKAIQLYHRGGDVPHALEICFRIGSGDLTADGQPNTRGAAHPHAAVAFDSINAIAQDLGADSSPQIVARCADFLVTHRQYARAVDLYVLAGRYSAAIEMCVQHRVQLTEDMIDALTPPEVVSNTSEDPSDPNNPAPVSSTSTTKKNAQPVMDISERRQILKDLARLLKKQGRFTLACRLYTQANDRVRAIKALVRSGDTKAVIQFANISRSAEIYILAANFLQQMDWRASIDVMRAIVTFYSKATAWLPLAGFYESCAQVEIEEYRDYEKAGRALEEALKHLQKAISPPAGSKSRSSAPQNLAAAEEMQTSIERRVKQIHKFIEVKGLYDENTGTVSPDSASRIIGVCEALLSENQHSDGHDECVRSGDLLSLLINVHVAQKQISEASSLLREFDAKRLSPSAYLDMKTLELLGSSSGTSRRSTAFEEAVDTESSINRGRRSPSNEEEVEEEVEEEIEEEIGHDSPVKNRRGVSRNAGYYGRK